MCKINKNSFCFQVAIVLFLLTGACKNPFATREAEPPSTDQSSWRVPTDPAVVLENMRNAILEKNVSNYMRCLADSNQLFRFLPDEYEASKNAGIFDTWQLEQEQGYINKLLTSIPDDSIRRLRFSLDYQRIDFADSILIRTDYELNLHHVLSSGYPKLAKGKCDFLFVRRQGFWVISRWEDHQTQNDFTATRIPSWSTIKASFLN